MVTMTDSQESVVAMTLSLTTHFIGETSGDIRPQGTSRFEGTLGQGPMVFRGTLGNVQSEDLKNCPRNSSEAKSSKDSF